mgnify:CR=1 FL=1
MSDFWKSYDITAAEYGAGYECYPLFGTVHLIELALSALFLLGMVWWYRRSAPRTRRHILVGVTAALLGDEAALLLGDPMPGVTGEAELHTAQTQAQRLTRICPRVLITGVAAGRGIACVGADRATGESLVRTPMVPKSFHGTGDIFGAVLVGRLLQGNVLPAAAQAAAVFVADCLKATPDEADERLGVWLESVLPQLMQNPE